MKVKLYHYWRSTSSWRVRWAFTLKGINCDYVPVNLLEGQSDHDEHLKRNPMGYVPVLELDGSRHLSESMAIIEWSDEVFPKPLLLPGDAYQRARIRQLCELINAGTQPLVNLGVAEAHSADADEKRRWQQQWIRKGLGAFEALVRETAGKYCLGDAITLADLFLIPQCYSAGRNHVPLSEFPTIDRINTAALATEACQQSHPDRFKPA